MPQENPGRGLTGAAYRHFEITPADGVDLPVRPRVLRVIQGGGLALRDASGTVIIYPVRTGETVAISPVGVEQTGTTAVVAGWV